ncbi:MAG: hypothetical protein KVP17_003257 [Porospora cf. gigantea B]|uniref:uncharacterized protein n=1 Tax=Porospora cf. gigantea B TaxID=2853592 RepID=UPI003571E61F|nr:MAG: hypothetical protein KVP17_003257 [Porospora cf. gigantea B]
MQPQPPLGPITRVPSRHAVQPVQPPLSGGLHVTPPMRPQRRMSFKNLPAGPLPTGEIGHTVVSSPFTAAAEALGSHVARGAGMNEELVGTVVRTMAGQITGDMSERTRQVQVWIPHFLVVIRAYFDVTHQYVLLKALALLFPFMEVGSRCGRHAVPAVQETGQERPRVAGLRCRRRNFQKG